jgi:hypothetical protein
VVTPADLPTSLALLAGDGILALSDEGSLAATQFTSSGALLSSATGGTFIATDQTGETAFQSNSQYVVPGAIRGTEGKTNIDAVVERFDLLNGEQDTTFLSPAFGFAPDAPNVKTVAAAIGVDSESRILVGAELETTTFGSGVARLNPNGSLDTTFGANGIGAIVPDFVVYSILVQPDNKVVMVGSSGNLARYLAQ